MKRMLPLAVLAAALAGVAILVVVPPGRAQDRLTVEPAMAKGAADSPVVIYEFSDYQ